MTTQNTQSSFSRRPMYDELQMGLIDSLGQSNISNSSSHQASSYECGALSSSIGDQSQAESSSEDPDSSSDRQFLEPSHAVLPRFACVLKSSTYLPCKVRYFFQSR